MIFFKYFFEFIIVLFILNKSINFTLSLPTQTEINLFEAAFQGECKSNGPCQHLCYDLHDGTFECSCKKGFTLSDNGYSCIEDQQILNNSIKIVHQILDENKLMKNKIKKYFNFNSCNQIQCEAGGICEEDKIIYKYQSLKKRNQIKSFKDVHKKLSCRCPLGRGGFFCEIPLIVIVPRFDGRSYLALPKLKNIRSHLFLEIKFKSETNNGLIFYTGEDQLLKNTFFSISINQGYIEVRFDCGNGLSILKSRNLLPLQTWTRLNFSKNNNYVYIQLDGQEQISTISSGLFDNIEYNLELFLGGSPNLNLISDRVGVKSGLVGCIRELRINKKNYDFRADNHGDAIDGIGIRDCKEDSCKQSKCLNGGLCSQLDEKKISGCLCPSGHFGNKCQLDLKQQALYFNENSMMQLPGIKESALSYLEIKLTFKSEKPNGLLLFNSNSMKTKNEDFIQINLINGYVYFTFDLGNGPATVRTSSIITINKWHNLVISRTTRLATISLDNQPLNQTVSNGAYTQLSLFKPLFIGGVFNNLQNLFNQNYLETNYLPQELSNENFKGCIQSIEINSKLVQWINSIYNLNIDKCRQ